MISNVIRFSASSVINPSVRFGSQGPVTFGPPPTNGVYNTVLVYHPSDLAKAREVGALLGQLGISIIMKAPADAQTAVDLNQGKNALLLLSSASLADPINQREATQAVENSQIHGKGKMIPLYLEPCEDKAPLFLSMITGVNLFGPRQERALPRVAAALLKD